MRNIYPPWLYKMGKEKVRRILPIRSQKHDRPITLVTKLRFKPAFKEKDRLNRFYAVKSRGKMHMARIMKEDLQYHFFIEERGPIRQCRAIDVQIGEIDEIVVGIQRNRKVLNKYERRAIRKIIEFFGNDIETIHWERGEWAIYGVDPNQKALDEFDQIWEQTMPKSGDVTIDDFRSLLKLIYTKK